MLRKSVLILWSTTSQIDKSWKIVPGSREAIPKKVTKPLSKVWTFSIQSVQHYQIQIVDNKILFSIQCVCYSLSSFQKKRPLSKSYICWYCFQISLCHWIFCVLQHQNIKSNQEGKSNQEEWSNVDISIWVNFIVNIFDIWWLGFCSFIIHVDQEDITFHTM